MSVGLALACGTSDAKGPPSGAAELFTSQDPVLSRVRQLVLSGQLTEADEVVQSAARSAPAVGQSAMTDAREIIRRLRREYDPDVNLLLARLRPSMPDVTADDVERWRAAGQVQSRIIDGHIAYFRREPSNSFRFCPEAIERRRKAGHAPADPSIGAGKLVEHLKQIVAAASTASAPEVLPVRHRVRYRITVLPDRPGAKAGSIVRCWLPFPQEYRQQCQVRLLRTQPAEHRIAPVGIADGEIRPEAQRTVYLERTIDRPSQPVVFEEQFEYVCRAYYPKLNEDLARPLSDAAVRPYLAERPPHILFTRELRDAVREAVKDESNPLRKVRRIYRYIAEHVRYCAEEEYCVIPSFSQKALTSGRGDCGIQSTLLITMCRAAGVPARWQSGWETKPWSNDMHDWAEFYIEPWGWLPADMSYGLQPSDDPAIREFYIGHLDSYRMIVNLDYGSPLVPPKWSLRSEPADFQRGEVELDGRNLYFDEWDYDIRFEWEPL